MVIWLVLALLLQSDHGTPCDPKPGYAWSGADVELVYLNAGDYPGLPEDIAVWLEARGFTIPQSYCASDTHNAFVADLAVPGSEDWAVLASRSDSSRIFVFWGGATDSVSEFACGRDSYYVCDEKRYGFPRMIAPETATDELNRYSQYQVTPPVELDHSGLEDIYCEKGSTVFYWAEGKRLDLIGAD